MPLDITSHTTGGDKLVACFKRKFVAHAGQETVKFEAELCKDSAMAFVSFTTMTHDENSEVLLRGSVAVAVRASPAASGLG